MKQMIGHEKSLGCLFGLSGLPGGSKVTHLDLVASQGFGGHYYSAGDLCSNSILGFYLD